MEFSAVWKTLEEMIADLRKRGVVMPAETLSDLKSARTMIRISKIGPAYWEAAQKIVEYLGKVESYLVSEGERRFGSEYADRWLVKLNESRRKAPEEEKETRFILGLPRKQKWVRVKPSAGLTLGRLRELVDESRLSCNTQNDGSLLVYGKDEDVKALVRKMATEYRLKIEK